MKPVRAKNAPPVAAAAVVVDMAEAEAEVVVVGMAAAAVAADSGPNAAAAAVVTNLFPIYGAGFARSDSAPFFSLRSVQAPASRTLAGLAGIILAKQWNNISNWKGVC